ncbi:CDKG-2, partial [Symbiodinium microadriaticum]
MSQKRSRWDSSSDEENDEKRGEVTARPKTASNEIKQPNATVITVGNVEGGGMPTDCDGETVIPVASKSDQLKAVLTGGDITAEDSYGASNRHIPLFHGCRSVDVYRRLNFIDQGTYGMVFRAECLDTGEQVALKQVKMTRNDQKVGFPITALRETNILLALRHPNIVSVKEMVVGSSIDKVYMVMEYLENDLKTCMDMSASPFSIAEVKRLMLQLLSAVNHMHKNWYIHRDLKTSNLLYSNKGKLAVCDFGMARKYGSPLAAYTFEVITLWYRAPELLLGQAIYSTAVD